MDSELTLDKALKMVYQTEQVKKQQVLLKNNFSSTPNADGDAVNAGKKKDFKRNPTKKSTSKHMSQTHAYEKAYAVQLYQV